MTTPDYTTALDIRFECDDLGETVSIRQYLHRLLKTLFNEGESFSGKRPFGNSGWEAELAKPLIEAGLLKGSIDDGFAEDYSEKKYWAIVFGMIDTMCGVSK